VYVFVADLHEAGAGFGEQVSRDEHPVSQVAQVGVDTELPGVPERLDLLGFACGVFELAVFDVTGGGRSCAEVTAVDDAWAAGIRRRVRPR